MKTDKILPLNTPRGAESGSKRRYIRKLDGAAPGPTGKELTLMYAYVKSSFGRAGAQADLSSRILIEQYHEDIASIIRKFDGMVVKTIGNGVLSYFESAADALMAGAEMQAATDRLNFIKNPLPPVLLSIGVHTGRCVIDRGDVTGEGVDAAVQFESIANPGEIYLSERTLSLAGDSTGLPIRFVKTAHLKAFSEPRKVYKVFWSATEAEARIITPPVASPNDAGKPAEDAGWELTGVSRLLLVFFVPFLLIFAFSKTDRLPSVFDSINGQRSVSHSATGHVEEGGERDAEEGVSWLKSIAARLHPEGR